MRHVVLTVIFFLTIAVPAFSENIVLKNGTVLKGTPVDETPDEIRVELEQSKTKMWLDRTRIQRIEPDSSTHRQPSLVEIPSQKVSGESLQKKAASKASGDERKIQEMAEILFDHLEPILDTIQLKDGRVIRSRIIKEDKEEADAVTISYNGIKWTYSHDEIERIDKIDPVRKKEIEAARREECLKQARQLFVEGKTEFYAGRFRTSEEISKLKASRREGEEKRNCSTEASS